MTRFGSSSRVRTAGRGRSQVTYKNRREYRKTFLAEVELAAYGHVEIKVAIANDAKKIVVIGIDFD